jgi:cyclic-di-GMP phosphodiesterase TipF (flagellum assembly factor)
MTKTSSADAPKGTRPQWLEIAILFAMALAAVAFTAGLHIQSGVALASSTIAGLALFLVMAASQTALTRAYRSADAVQKVEEFETSIGGLSSDIERMGGIAARFEGLDQLIEKVTRLEKAVEKVDGLDAMGEIEEVTKKVLSIERMSSDLERLDTRVEAIKQQIQFEAEERQDKISSELQMLETLVKQLAEKMTYEGRAPVRVKAPVLRDEPEPTGEAAPAPAQSAAPPPEAAQEEEAGWDADALERAEDFMIDMVRQSLEANKVDLYLQPIVSLPQRKVEAYEALTRLRGETDEVIMPKDYLPIAEQAGMMPLIDNVMLFRCVQVLRRLSERSSGRSVFCNISVHSLLDPEFFPEFISFMDRNSGLSKNLIFEFTQAMMNNCGALELESLNALSSLGFRFCLDHVHDLSTDFEALYGKGFRFVKIDADVFLNRMAEVGAPIHPADMRAYLDRYGIDLIIEKVEDENSLRQLLEHDVKTAQGFLFSEPRPVRPEIFDESDAASAA